MNLKKFYDIVDNTSTKKLIRIRGEYVKSKKTNGN